MELKLKSLNTSSCIASYIPLIDLNVPNISIIHEIVKVNQQFLKLTAKDQVLVLLYGSQRNNFENLNQNIIILLSSILNQQVTLTYQYLMVTNKSCVFLVKIFLIWYVLAGFKLCYSKFFFFFLILSIFY